MTRPSWEGDYYCAHGIAPHMNCAKCVAEAAREKIDREMIEVLKGLGKMLELLAHPLVSTSEPPK